LKTPNGAEALRIVDPKQISRLNDWVHDAYLEDAIQFSAEDGRAVIPFAQESAWGHLHPSMPDPELVKQTLFAHHYRIPMTRCFLAVEHATSLETDIEWGNPMILEADFFRSTFRLLADTDSAMVSVRVTELDIRVVVSSEQAKTVYRKVLRGWPIESDRQI
jgi:hypothetical protein